MTDKPKRCFVINDKQFHEDALRAMDEFDPTDREAQIEVAWHSTAVNFWDYGLFHDMDGPAAEVDGRPVLIEREFQLGIDDNGYPFMRYFPIFRQYTLPKFDVGGVTLRDVTIRWKGDRISYSLPDCVDQGGAVRQFVRPLRGELTQPVLKSAIQEACETHAKEGGYSDG